MSMSANTGNHPSPSVPWYTKVGNVWAIVVAAILTNVIKHFWGF